MCEERKLSASRRKIILYAYKFFFYAYKKMPFSYRLYADDNTEDCKESKLPQIVALCHNEVNSIVPFSQKAQLMIVKDFMTRNS